MLKSFVINLCLTMLLTIFLTCVAFSQSKIAVKNPITIEDVMREGILGHLRVPLGTVVEIDATVIDGDSLRTKATAGVFLLQVNRVNNVELKAPAVMTFGHAVAGDDVMPNSHFQLFEMVTGERPVTLSSAEIDKMKPQYVGKHKRLLVYETGGYEGLPTKLPPNTLIRQDTRFHFATSLVVLKSADDSPSPAQRTLPPTAK